MWQQLVMYACRYDKGVNNVAAISNVSLQVMRGRSPVPIELQRRVEDAIVDLDEERDVRQVVHEINDSLVFSVELAQHLQQEIRTTSRLRYCNIPFDFEPQSYAGVETTKRIYAGVRDNETQATKTTNQGKFTDRSMRRENIPVVNTDKD